MSRDSRTIHSPQDAIDLLEKRVKSRFSHRQIFFYPAETVESYADILRQALLVPREALSSKIVPDSSLVAFNERVEAFLADENVAAKLRALFDLEKSVRALYKIMVGVGVFALGPPIYTFRLAPGRFPSLGKQPLYNCSLLRRILSRSAHR